MSKKSTATIELFVAVRYFVKSTKSIISIVVSGDNRYIVTLNRSKQHTCTCAGFTKGHKQCKHIKFCVERENARAARENAARKQEAVLAHATAKPRSEAPLAYRPFSLMR